MQAFLNCAGAKNKVTFNYIFSHRFFIEIRIRLISKLIENSVVIMRSWSIRKNTLI